MLKRATNRMCCVVANGKSQTKHRQSTQRTRWMETSMTRAWSAVEDAENTLQPGLRPEMTGFFHLRSAVTKAR